MAKVDGMDGEKMTAVHITEWLQPGTVPEKISFGQINVPPAPKKAEVIISVKGASIQGDDVALMQDTWAGGTAHSRKPTADNPVIGGTDYAGVVLAVGPNCSKLKVGDRVCGIVKPYEYQMGTWADKILANEKDVCVITDDSISFVDAAAAQMGTFVSADLVRLASSKLEKDGCRSIVVGASGAIGLVLLQMLKKYKNGHVTAICSGSNAEKCKSMGATETIDYTVKPFGEQLADKDKYDVVFDLVGGKDIEAQSRPLLKKSGAMFITAVGETRFMGMEGKLEGVGGMICRIICRSMCGCCYSPYKWVLAQPYPPMKQDIFEKYVVNDKVRASISEEIPFQEAPIRQAMTRVFQHHAGGRVVINMESSA